MSQETVEQIADDIAGAFVAEHDLGSLSYSALARVIRVALQSAREEGRQAALRVIVERDPYIAGEIDGDPTCYWCGQWQMEPHDDECVWLRSRAAQPPAEEKP